MNMPAPSKVYEPDSGQLGLPTVTCLNHEYEVIDPPDLAETLTPDTYASSAQALYKMPTSSFTVQCRFCGLTKKAYVPSVCPKCLRGVETASGEPPRDAYEGVRQDPDLYFDRFVHDTTYCRAMVRRCSCGFGYVWLLYDR